MPAWIVIRQLTVSGANVQSFRATPQAANNAKGPDCYLNQLILRI